MCLVLGGLATPQVVRKNAFKLCAIHTTSLPDTAVRPLIFFRPFRLCWSGGAHAISTVLCAAATYYFRWNSQSFPRSRCARIPQYRAEQRSYDNREVTRQPLFAVATGQ